MLISIGKVLGAWIIHFIPHANREPFQEIVLLEAIKKQKYF
jgi:hypothetical protein